MIENESGEDYLEAILRLSAEKQDVHAVEVARELGVSKPAVTKALRILVQKGYVEIAANHIRLTDSGRAYASSVYEKHRLITRFIFIKLGVDAQKRRRRTPAAWSTSSAPRRTPPSSASQKKARREAVK